MMADTIGRFWMVWNPQGRSPTYRHHSRAEADAEARRLAAANPDKFFIVLKVVGAFTARTSIGDPESVGITEPVPPRVIHTLRDPGVDAYE